MISIQTFPIVEETLAGFAVELAADHSAYRNHVCRLLHFFLELTGLAFPTDAVLIAAAFHDLGIWTRGTLDYLLPSMDLASNFLAKAGLADLEDEVRTIIYEHHKLSSCSGLYSLQAEAFRRADLIDLSLGAVRFGLPRPSIRAVRAAFPNAGFHRRLAVLSVKQFLRSPLRPLPMFHW